MQLILAPMEGVLDHLMREILTTINPYDLCVTEFVRVVDKLHPPKVYKRIAPELLNNGKTAAGTPVRVQLLGQDPACLAENAAQAVNCGSPGIDLNFGCPAKTVNKSRGGAILLKEPNALFDIVNAVKQAVPTGTIVSAKIRLGFEDDALFHDNVQAIVEAGATSLAIHARTKTDGYKPPAYWDKIASLKHYPDLEIIANGEIWSAAHAKRCIEVTGIHKLMVGRGALALPNLGATIKRGDAPLTWEKILELLIHYSTLEMKGDKGLYYANRAKQWLSYLRLQYPQAEELFHTVKRLKKGQDIVNAIHACAHTL